MKACRASPGAVERVWRRGQAVAARWAAPPVAQQGQAESVLFEQRREAPRRQERRATAPGARPNGPQARPVRMLLVPSQADACRRGAVGAGRKEFAQALEPRAPASAAVELADQARQACWRRVFEGRATKSPVADAIAAAALQHAAAASLRRLRATARVRVRLQGRA